MMRKVVYPGSFDPITKGHIDVIERALGIFDEVIVAVASNPAKTPTFTLDERVKFIRNVFKRSKKVTVKTFKGLVVRFAEKEGAKCILRGLRATSDFDYEFQMALTNRNLSKKKIETIFLTPSQKYFYVSSRLSRELAALQASVSDIVPIEVARELRKKYTHSGKNI